MERNESDFFDNMDYTLYDVKSRASLLERFFRECREGMDEFEGNGVYCLIDDIYSGITKLMEQVDEERERRKQAA